MIYNNNGTLLKLPNVIQIRTNSLSKKKQCEIHSKHGNHFGFNYLQQKLPKIVVSSSCSKGDASFVKKVCCNNKKGNWFMNDMKNICFNKCSMLYKRNERTGNDCVNNARCICDCSELSTNNTNETYGNNGECNNIETAIRNKDECVEESEISDNSVFTLSLLSSKPNELQDNIEMSNQKISSNEYSFSLSDNESMCYNK